jgi:hypothetical protein
MYQCNGLAVGADVEEHLAFALVIGKIDLDPSMRRQIAVIQPVNAVAKLGQSFNDVDFGKSGFVMRVHFNSSPLIENIIVLLIIKGLRLKAIDVCSSS